MKQPRLLFILLLVYASAVLLSAGLTVPVSLGDEIHHYRFAKESFNVEGRGIFESIYGSSDEPGFFFETEAAWPLGLAYLWRLTGGISFSVAQIYHHLFYLLLLFSVYKLAAKFYGEKEAVWCALITASAPMAVSFGILFYLDVPAAALCTTTLWLLAEGVYPAAGFSLGLQFLMKRSAAFFTPVYAAWVLIRHWRKPVRCVLNLALVLIPAALLAFWDQSWRKAHLVNVILTPKWIQSRLNEIAAAQNPPASLPPEVPSFLFRIKDYSYSNILNPADFAKYFGLALILGILIYLFRRSYGKKEVLLAGLASVFMGAAFLLRLFPDIRYLMPILPLLAIPAGRAVSHLSKQWLKGAIAVLCLLQIPAAAVYTHQQRRLSPGIVEAFSYIEKNIPEKLILLYPETNIMEYAKRKMVWGRIGLGYLFWGTEAEKKEQILRFKIDYIGVKKNRIYEDRNLQQLHFGKYPQSFLDDLKKFSWIRQIYENSDLVLYQIDRASL